MATDFNTDVSAFSFTANGPETVGFRATALGFDTGGIFVGTHGGIDCRCVEDAGPGVQGRGAPGVIGQVGDVSSLAFTRPSGPGSPATQGRILAWWAYRTKASA